MPLSWALSFFIAAIIAAVFGFTGILEPTTGEVAKILFVVFIVLFLVALVTGLLHYSGKNHRS